MPTKRTFDLILISYIGLRLGEAVVKMWARRTIAEPGYGAASAVAEAVITDLS